MRRAALRVDSSFLMTGRGGGASCDATHHSAQACTQPWRTWSLGTHRLQRRRARFGTLLILSMLFKVFMLFESGFQGRVRAGFLYVEPLGGLMLGSHAAQGRLHRVASGSASRGVPSENDASFK